MDVETKIKEVGEVNILDYLDYRAYLNDKVKSLQRQNSKYSLRWIAQKAGIKSPHLISMILNGKRRLSKQMAPLLAYALDLSETEESYFVLLVDLAHEDNTDRQQELIERIQAYFKNGIFKNIPTKGLEVISKWYLPALRELVTFNSFNASPKWISKKLNISENEAKEALALLTEKEFIKKSASDKYVRAEPSIHAPDQIKPIVMANYHLQAINKAINSMALPKEKRHFETLTFSIPKNLMPELRLKIQGFFREIDMFVESQKQREELVQMNLQLFTLATDDEENK